jgi:hypothetical protein
MNEEDEKFLEMMDVLLAWAAGIIVLALLAGVVMGAYLP